METDSPRYTFTFPKFSTWMELLMFQNRALPGCSIADDMANISVCQPKGDDLPDAIDWSDRYGWTALTALQVDRLRFDYFQALLKITEGDL